MQSWIQHWVRHSSILQGPSDYGGIRRKTRNIVKSGIHIGGQRAELGWQMCFAGPLWCVSMHDWKLPSTLHSDPVSTTPRSLPITTHTITHWVLQGINVCIPPVQADMFDSWVFIILLSTSCIIIANMMIFLSRSNKSFSDWQVHPQCLYSLFANSVLAFVPGTTH